MIKTETPEAIQKAATSIREKFFPTSRRITRKAMKGFLKKVGYLYIRKWPSSLDMVEMETIVGYYVIFHSETGAQMGAGQSPWDAFMDVVEQHPGEMSIILGKLMNNGFLQ